MVVMMTPAMMKDSDDDDSDALKMVMMMVIMNLRFCEWEVIITSLTKTQMTSLTVRLYDHRVGGCKKTKSSNSK